MVPHWLHCEDTIKVLIGERDQCHDVNRRLHAELSRLTADNERLRAALTKAADAMGSVTAFVTSRERISRPTGEAWWAMEKSEIRAALTKEPTP